MRRMGLKTEPDARSKSQPLERVVIARFQQVFSPNFRNAGTLMVLWVAVVTEVVLFDDKYQASASSCSGVRKKDMMHRNLCNTPYIYFYISLYLFVSLYLYISVPWKYRYIYI